MPITRRRRANPPDQPENNNHLADQPENNADTAAVERPAEASGEAESQHQAQAQAPEQQVPPTPPVTPVRIDNVPYQPYVSTQPPVPPVSNGDRVEQRPERAERQDYTPTIESGRRTARGELFRRPPQPPVAQSVPSINSAPLQPPSHEISLPLGNLLHLAYNPGYTGSDEARSALLQQLANESKSGGRARCWSCGSLAIAYDRWNTRSKTFGEVGIAFCEICGVWSVM